MNDFDPMLTLRASIRRALKGQEHPRLAAVTCGLAAQRIAIDAYLDEPVTEKDKNWLREISTEVIADFPAGFVIEEHCCAKQEGAGRMLDFWAYQRP